MNYFTENDKGIFGIINGYEIYSGGDCQIFLTVDLLKLTPVNGITKNLYEIVKSISNCKLQSFSIDSKNHLMIVVLNVGE